MESENEEILFTLVATNGVTHTIYKDGILTNGISHCFQVPLGDSEISSSSTSYFGNFIYFIIDSNLFLVTVTVSSAWVDPLVIPEMKFVNACFSIEESMLYALTSSNQIVVFKTLPIQQIGQLNIDLEEIVQSFSIFNLQSVFELIVDDEKRYFAKLPNRFTNKVQKLEILPSLPIPPPQILEKIRITDRHTENNENLYDEDPYQFALNVNKKGKEVLKRQNELLSRYNDLLLMVDRAKSVNTKLDLRVSEVRNKTKEQFQRIQRLLISQECNPELIEKQHSDIIEIKKKIGRAFVVDNNEISISYTIKFKNLELWNRLKKIERLMPIPQ